MLTCKEVAGLLSSDATVDGPISDRLRVKLHLFMCKHCREYAAQLQVVGAVGRELAGDCTDEPETLHRLEQAILMQIQEPSASEEE